MKLGCLLIHGFTGGTFEVEPLAFFLKEKGFEIEIPTLPGHGEDIKNLSQVTYGAWLDKVIEAYIELSRRTDKVVVVGFSMGGLLALNLVTRFPAAGLVLLSTPIYVWDLRKFGKLAFQGIRKKDYVLLRQYMTKFRETPIGAALQFRKLLNNTKHLLTEVTLPSLVIQGQRDPVVKSKSAQYLYAHLGSKDKELHYLPESGHVVCCGAENKMVFRLVLEFINRTSL